MWLKPPPQKLWHLERRKEVKIFKLLMEIDFVIYLYVLVCLVVTFLFPLGIYLCKNKLAINASIPSFVNFPSWYIFKIGPINGKNKNCLSYFVANKNKNWYVKLYIEPGHTIYVTGPSAKLRRKSTATEYSWLCCDQFHNNMRS